jgi:hypothetical protein
MKGSNRRRYFTEAELAKLIKAARDGRYGQRDATLTRCAAGKEERQSPFEPCPQHALVETTNDKALH